MYQKERKLNPVLLIVLAAALLAVGIAVLFLLTHVWVAGTFYSRNADVLDLRFADVTTADYDKLRKKAPNSEILWRIPFQGKTYDQDTDVLYVTSLTDEDVATLDYFTRLKTVEAQECTDYPQLAALTARRPEVTVEYAVTIDGREYPQDTAVVSISGITEEEINLLTYLPELTAVTARSETEQTTAINAGKLILLHDGQKAKIFTKVGREIAVATSALMKEYDVAIWAHHGMFCSGEDFDLTFGLMHTVEKSAEILVKMLSMRPDKRQTISPQNFRDLAKDFKVTLPEKFLYGK